MQVPAAAKHTSARSDISLKFDVTFILCRGASESLALIRADRTGKRSGPVITQQFQNKPQHLCFWLQTQFNSARIRGHV